MSDEPRAFIYIEHIVPCPSCGEDLALRLPVGFIEQVERRGVSEAARN